MNLVKLSSMLFALSSLLLTGTAGAGVDMNQACTMSKPAPNVLVWSDCPDIQPVKAEKFQLAHDISASYLRIDKPSFDALLKDHPDAKLRVMLVNDPCLAQMEAAMAAVEPYLLVLKSLGKGDSLAMLNGFDAALKTWQSAKRECWCTP